MLSKFSSNNKITKTGISLPKQFAMFKQPTLGLLGGLK